MTPIGPAAQNAEMARFKKSQIFDRTSVEKSKNYLFVERALFLFLRRRCLRDTVGADLLFSFFSNFPLFELKKLGLVVNSPKKEHVNWPKNTVLRQSLSTAAGSALFEKTKLDFF